MPRAFSYTRRELMFGLAGTALAFSKVRNSMYNPQIAAHTSIWLSEAERRAAGAGEILDEAFAAISRAGFRRVELAPQFLAPGLRERTLALLEKRNLEPSVLFTTGPMGTPEAGENSRKEAKDLAWLMMGRGAHLLNFLPSRNSGEPKTNDQLDTEAYQLNRMGDELRATGLELTVHHGPADMRDNAREWRRLLAQTDPALVSFCLDLDWIARAGLSPRAMIDTAGPRLRAVHLRNPQRGVNQAVLRNGDIDMAPISRLLRQMSYDGYLVVELLYDPESRPLYSLAKDLSLSRWYAQEMFGIRPGYPPVDMGPHVRP